MTPAYPSWLHALSITSVVTALACAAIIAGDEIRRPQKMWIMNLVWPLTALFGGLLWLAGYYAWGRTDRNRDDRRTPMAIAVAKGASHCGAGCTLGDIVVEWAAFAFPGLAALFGWGALFREKTFAIWIPDYLLAFLIGIVFQYFSIKPMRNLSAREAVVQAVKADGLSISAWQVGMYGAMAAAQFGWLRPAYGTTAPVDTPEFWFVMQLAMLCGFATSYPVNWLLVRWGVKERM